MNELIDEQLDKILTFDIPKKIYNAKVWKPKIYTIPIIFLYTF